MLDSMRFRTEQAQNGIRGDTQFSSSGGWVFCMQAQYSRRQKNMWDPKKAGVDPLSHKPDQMTLVLRFEFILTCFSSEFRAVGSWSLTVLAIFLTIPDRGVFDDSSLLVEFLLTVSGLLTIFVLPVLFPNLWVWLAFFSEGLIFPKGSPGFLVW